MRRAPFLLGALVAALVAGGAPCEASAVTGGAKFGLFLPNGKADGLKGWDNGWGAEVDIGGRLFGPFSLEGGIAVNTAKPSSDSTLSLANFGATLTGKCTLPLGPLSFYAGAGAGYYYLVLEDSRSDENRTDSGPGVHAVAGVLVGSVLVEVKWFEEKLDLGAPRKVDFGGVMLNVGAGF